MRAALLALSLVAATACGADAPAPEPSPTPQARERVAATLDGVQLQLEVADEPAERAVGLMHREEVPPGTGMVFLYGEPVEERFYMFQVPVPLQAVFVRAGRVVSAVVMEPCAEREPQDCPTYGADGPYDTVVETAPETLPDVEPGDELVPAQPGA